MARNPNRLPSDVVAFNIADVEFKDNEYLFFGDDHDAALHYDGTDLILSPKLVGTGSIKIPAGSQIILPLNSDATKPQLCFYDGDTGFYAAYNDTISVSLGGVTQWRIQATEIIDKVTSGFAIKYGAASLTVPVYTFNGDYNTGIGHGAQDELSLIAGAIEGHRITEVSNLISHIMTGIVKTPTTQTLTGAGAVDIVSALTLLVTTAADALTLANGAEGQAKYIVMKTYGGIGTLTPTALKNGTTLTFDAVGDSAFLIYMDGAWVFMGGTATLG